MAEFELMQRVERIEAQLAIQQLPVRYALAVDGRDLDALVGLFVDDVAAGRWGEGRPGLRNWYDYCLRTFYRSIHQICGHTIDLVDADHATGTVYCRAEHEDGDKWVVVAICYFDTYERRNGQWFFVRRKEKHWYSSDIVARPAGPNFQAWPDKWEDRAPALPAAFPHWSGFWQRSAAADIAHLTIAPAADAATK